jgi:hypothetical protein
VICLDPESNPGKMFKAAYTIIIVISVFAIPVTVILEKLMSQFIQMLSLKGHFTKV